MRTPFGYDAATTWGGHARAESVATFAYQFAGLISPFHIITPIKIGPLVNLNVSVGAVC